MNSSPAGEASQRKTACERLLELFETHRDQEIPLTRILALHIAQYNTRIRELRQAGHVIENRCVWEGPVKHSWYTYRGKISREPAA